VILPAEIEGTNCYEAHTGFDRSLSLFLFPLSINKRQRLSVSVNNYQLASGSENKYQKVSEKRRTSQKSSEISYWTAGVLGTGKSARAPVVLCPAHRECASQRPA
jgi:hypothetical protein